MEDNFIRSTLNETVLAAATGTDKSWPISGHLSWLGEFIQKNDIHHITEFGVEYGASTSLFLFALGLSCGTLRSYDIEEKENVAALKRLRPETVDWVFINASSLEVEIEETEFLFIDSFHEYIHLKKELALHSKKVKRFIGFHDTETYGETSESNSYSQFNSGLGIRMAIEEFLRASPGWFVHYHTPVFNGLTILERTEL